MTKRVGLFGGSFDPIHFGHLNLALSLMERQNLDEVLFCPAHTSPLKKGEPPRASKEDRLKMVGLAIEEIKGFSVLDFEIKKPPPSFTIDTVRFLLSKGKIDLHLILGEDSLRDLAKWKEIEELLRLAPPFVGSRVSELSALSPALMSLVEEGVIRTPVIEISSTEIRARLGKGLFCGHLVPAKVLQHINKNFLYTHEA